jgi:hypothetical protein
MDRRWMNAGCSTHRRKSNVVCLASQAAQLGPAKGQCEAEDLGAPVGHCQILGRRLSYFLPVRVVE